MMRTSIGISKLPVDSEIDPGFGPDTEQRRVEFASKLEQEAFSIAVGDAEKLARSNLITALKLWGNEDLIKLVERLHLREIMIIWLIFEIAYLSTIWRDCFNDRLQAKISSTKKLARKFPLLMLTALFKGIPEEIESIPVPKECVKSVREALGGDLIFALKQKNEDEIIKLYEMTYAKLPYSLRRQFHDIIRGVSIDYEKVLSILKKDPENILDQLIQLVTDAINNLKDYSINKKVLNSMLKIIGAFNTKSSNLFRKSLTIQQVKQSSEVKEKVKKYYGITDKDENKKNSE